MKWARGRYDWNKETIYEENEDGVMLPICTMRNPKYTELILSLPELIKQRDSFQTMSWSMHHKIPEDKS